MSRPRQTHQIEIGHAEREIRFDFNAICDFEDASGLSATQFGQLSEDQWKLKYFRDLVWAGLVDRGNITPRDVGNWLQEEMEQDRLDTVMEQLMEAFTDSFPEAEEEAAGEGKDSEQAGTG